MLSYVEQASFEGSPAEFFPSDAAIMVSVHGLEQALRLVERFLEADAVRRQRAIGMVSMRLRLIGSSVV